MEIQKHIQGKTFEEVKEYLTTNFFLVVKEDKNLPNLYLITFNKDKYEEFEKMVEDHSFLNSCRGIILEKETNKVICHSLDKGIEFDYDVSPPELEKYGLKFENCIIEESVEGTQLRLYHYEDKWRVATIGCMDANMSFWHSKKSFGQLFDEVAKAVNLDYSKLNKNHCYVLVLQHPENRIVINYSEPQLVHILTRDLSQDECPEIDVSIGLTKPVKYQSFQNFDDFWKDVEENKDMKKEGYFLKDTITGKKIKIMTKFYRNIKELRGNVTQNNIAFHFYSLKKSGKVAEYLEYYPEDKENFRNIEKNVLKVITDIHQQYCDKFVNKKLTMKEVFFPFRPFIYDIHGNYIKTHDVVTRKRVAEELYKMEPAQISFIVNQYNKTFDVYKAGGDTKELSSSGPKVGKGQTEQNQERQSSEETKEG